MSNKIIGYKNGSWQKKMQLTEFSAWKRWGGFSWTDGEKTFWSAFDSDYTLRNYEINLTDAPGFITWHNNGNKYVVPSGINGGQVFAKNIWTDGTNTYYSSGSSVQYVLNKQTKSWEVKNWTNIPYDGCNVWHDGEHIYYSGGNIQYEFNRSTGDWEEKTWNVMPNQGVGVEGLVGEYIWTDGRDIYCSNVTTVDNETVYYHYILDRANDTWSPKTWNYGSIPSQGLIATNNFTGYNIWNHNGNTYYSHNDDQYKLDVATSTWNPFPMRYLYGNSVEFEGHDVFHIGQRTFMSIFKTGSQYPGGYVGFINELSDDDRFWVGIDSVTDVIIDVIDSSYPYSNVWHNILDNKTYINNEYNELIYNEELGKWEKKPNTGALTPGRGADIWDDGTDLYYDSAPTRRKFNKETGQWDYNNATLPSQLSNYFKGRHVWHAGDHVYYSDSYSQYELNKSTGEWESKTWEGISDLFYFKAINIWHNGNDVYFSSYSKHYKLNVDTSTWEQVTFNGYSQFSGADVWEVNGKKYISRKIGSTTNYVYYVLEEDTWVPVTWENIPDFQACYVWNDSLGNAHAYTDYANYELVFEPIYAKDLNEYLDKHGLATVVEQVKNLIPEVPEIPEIPEQPNEYIGSEEAWNALTAEEQNAYDKAYFV